MKNLLLNDANQNLKQYLDHSNIIFFIKFILDNYPPTSFKIIINYHLKTDGVYDENLFLYFYLFLNYFNSIHFPKSKDSIITIIITLKTINYFYFKQKLNFYFNHESYNQTNFILFIHLSKNHPLHFLSRIIHFQKNFFPQKIKNYFHSITINFPKPTSSSLTFLFLRLNPISFSHFNLNFGLLKTFF
jgi:hypothetical protein